MCKGCEKKDVDEGRKGWCKSCGCDKKDIEGGRKGYV